MAHVAQYKKNIVEDFAKLIAEYPIVGVVNMSHIPAPQLQKIRKLLSDKGIQLKMTKKRLMKIAFDNSGKKEIGKLEEHFEGMPALIFTKENPFKLSMMLDKNRSPAPAKPGQTATKNITVNAGPTSFTPGPVIGMLGKVGIKTGIEKGKIVIKEDVVVAKRGDVISGELSMILGRLGVEPMEIGLSLLAVYEEGVLYTQDLLSVKPEDYLNKLSQCSLDSLNLAVYLGYATKETINHLMLKAYSEASALAKSQDIVTKDNIIELISQAHQIAVCVSGTNQEAKAGPVVDVPDKEKKPEKKDESEVASGLGALFG